MRPGQPAIPLEEARRIVDRELAGRSLPTETVPVREAVNRVLAGDARSALDVPPFDRSAVDGYALPEGDKREEFEIAGTLAAGRTLETPLQPGQAIKIMTGAPIPEGTGEVVMLEDTERRGGRVRVLRRGRSNFCPRGEDLCAGDVILPAGTLLRPVDIANLLACGVTQVKAARRPTLGVLCTGSEIVDDPALLRPGQIMNSNGPLLGALAAQHGLAVTGPWVAEDEPRALERAMYTALETADLVAVSGGVSVGEFDLVPDLLKRAGLTVHFSGVAIKPGMPITFATGPRQIVFGLPGNPVAAYLTFHLFVLRGVSALTGGRYPVRSFRLPLAHVVRRKRAERFEFLPAQLTLDGRVQQIEYHGSGHLAALSAADGFFGVPQEMNELPEGATVEFFCVGLRSDATVEDRAAHE
jgi:molybdopterin molybdotransferase